MFNPFRRLSRKNKPEMPDAHLEPVGNTVELDRRFREAFTRHMKEALSEIVDENPKENN